MFCPKCGTKVSDDARFCPSCGAGLTPVQPAEAPVQPAAEMSYSEVTPVQPAADPVYTYTEAPVQESPAKTADAKGAMIMSIIALVLSEFGLPGIILSAIASNKVKAYKAKYGEISGMAKVANILSKIALPVSIVMTVVWVVMFIIWIAVLAAGGAAIVQSGDPSNLIPSGWDIEFDF